MLMVSSLILIYEILFLFLNFQLFFMKLSIMILACFISLTVISQNSGTVNITVNGNRNKEVRVDGQSYIVNPVNTEVSGTVSINTPIQITSLSPGQHSIEIVRTGRYNNTNRTGNTTTFNLRTGYDMNITVNNDGSVQISEKRIRRNTGYQNRYRSPMNDETFDALVGNIQYMRGTSAKVTAINNAFNKTSNYFTTAQATELIRLVPSQSSRLNLAKASYKTITDPENFSQINELLSSPASRTELATYAKNYDSNNPVNTGTNPVNNGNANIAMPENAFNQLYSDARNQSSANSKMSYLANVFADPGNHFTTMQVKQMIGLVYPENDRLTLAKAAYDNVVDKANFTQVYDLLGSTAARNDLASYTGLSNPTYTKAAMTDASFNNLYTNISNQFGLGAKMASLTNEFNNTNNYFTTAQTRQLIQLVSDENNRLQLAKLAYNNVVDPENYSQLYNLLSSQYSRNELDVYVKANSNGNTGNSVRTPMTDASFNNLYNNISNQFGLGVKMSSLTNEFNNTNNYFTTAQTRQLIQLVSDENNRLQLAKLSYDNIVDPENFSRLYDLFTSQSSRTELAEYVRTYSYNR
jgi:hypothetical protein